jgi:hypothetical protein
MRVLFIPCPTGGASHLIPLVKLHSLLAPGVESAFLFSAQLKEDFGALCEQLFGIRVLDVDNLGSVSSQLAAYAKFPPDVVVDDTDLCSAYTRQCKRVPRVTIARTGIFPNIEPKNGAHSHSMGSLVGSMPSVASYGFTPFTRLADFFEADVRVVPGVRSVEIVDASLADDPNCRFAGPLIIDDVFVSDEIKAFFLANQRRKKIYLTYGAVQHAAAPAMIGEFIDHALRRGVAVVTNISRDSARFSRAFPTTFFQDDFLPMHFVCENVHGIFHHCGSATYHYPILHGMWSVTLGTQCYDRDDVATRLESLGVSRHIASPAENPGFLASLLGELDKLISAEPYVGDAARRSIAALKAEIVGASSGFSFMDALHSAVTSVGGGGGRGPPCVGCLCGRAEPPGLFFSGLALCY